MRNNARTAHSGIAMAQSSGRNVNRFSARNDRPSVGPRTGLPLPAQSPVLRLHIVLPRFRGMMKARYAGSKLEGVEAIKNHSVKTCCRLLGAKLL